MEHSQANTTNEKLEKKKLSLTSPTFSNFSFQSSDSKVSSVNTSMAHVNNKPQISNSAVHGRPIQENRKQGNNKGKKFIADDFVPLQDNSSILAELNKSTPAGEVKEGTKKKKKKNKKKDVEDHPWAKPLKKPTKTAEAFVEKKFAKFEVKEEKRQAAKKRNVEEAKENKVEEEKEKVKKVNFVRIRDIIKQHFSKRKIAEQPKKLDLQKMKQLLGIKKKKKMSKMKRAKLQYLESKMRHERQKASKKQDDDGYETIEETDPNKPIEDEEQEIKKDAEPQDKDNSREHSEDEEISDQSKNFVAKYGEIIPEILLPSEKRPQTVYKETMAIRNWVDHILCDEIDNLAFTLLNKLVCTQVLKKLNQPNKFKKRVVCGMREVLRTIESNLTDRSSQCVLIAVNVQVNPMRDGGDEKMLEIIAKARRKGIPIVHTCTRKRLGQACTGNDFARISVASITNYFGADELYKELLELVEKRREEFKQKVESSENL